MTILDHPTPLPPAASELPASPFNGIEIPAAQHLPDLPAEDAAVARTAALPAVPANDATAAAATVSEFAENSRESSEDGRLSAGKAGTQRPPQGGTKYRYARPRGVV